MKPIIFTILTTAILIFSTQHADCQTRKATEFRHASGTKTGLADFKMQLRADTIQAQTEQGLQFSVLIQNSSNKEKWIVNPLETIVLAVLNSKNKPVNIPVIPAAFINAGSGKKPGSYNSFSVDQVKINGKTSSMNLFADAFSIPAGGTCELFLGVRKILSPAAIKPYKQSDEISTSSDRYTLMVSLGIIGADPSIEPKDRKKGDVITADPLTITYGNLHRQ